MKSKKTKKFGLDKCTLEEFLANKEAFEEKKQKIFEKRQALLQKIYDLGNELTEESKKYGIPYSDSVGYFLQEHPGGYASFVPETFLPKFGEVLESLSPEEFEKVTEDVYDVFDGGEFSIIDFAYKRKNYSYDGWMSSSC